jgi:hypothetical protein
VDAVEIIGQNRFGLGKNFSWDEGVWYVCICIYTYILTKTYNMIQIQTMSAKAMKTTTTIWPVLRDTSQQLG